MALQDKILEQFVKTVDFGKIASQLVAKLNPVFVAEIVKALAKGISAHADELNDELGKDYDGDGKINREELKDCALQLQECSAILFRIYGEVADESK